MKYEEMSKLMEEAFDSIRLARKAGQKEYSRNQEDVFANFNRVAEAMKLPREKVLMVYLLKHIDGISAWVEGHKSQREEVDGRIVDAITYLLLLYGMVVESRKTGTLMNGVLYYPMNNCPTDLCSDDC